MGWEIIIERLALALLLGAAIGFERQWRQRLAGLRTNALVALGAASFVVFSVISPGPDSVARVAAQVVSGIGFLAGGVILREGINIRGLNTAATLWCAAAVGALSGGGYLAAAVLAAGFVIGANLFLQPLVRLINRSTNGRSGDELDYVVTVTCHAEGAAAIRDALLQSGDERLSLRQLKSTHLDGRRGVQIAALFHVVARADRLIEDIVTRFTSDSAVFEAKWRLQEQPE